MIGYSRATRIRDFQCGAVERVPVETRRGAGACTRVLVRGDDAGPPAVSLAIRPCLSPLKGVEVTIQDNGAGAEEDDLARLCEEGFRGRRCAGVPGTGLGLHIAKQLVELLDGALLLERVSEGAGLRARIQMRAAGLDDSVPQVK